MGVDGRCVKQQVVRPYLVVHDKHIIAVDTIADPGGQKQVSLGPRLATYLLSGNTIPAESRSALKPLTESKTRRKSN